MTIIRNFAFQLAARIATPSLRSDREEGQTLAEYALILALIALLVVGAIEFLGGDIKTLFSDIGDKL